MPRLAPILAISLALPVAMPAFAQNNDAREKSAIEKQEPALTDASADLAFGAFQRGHYLTAYAEATRLIETNKDPKAMTLVGEILANGLGVKPDEKRAAYWYGRAAEAGDREANYALGLLHLQGRGVARDRAEAAKRFRSAAEQGHPAAAYNLALLYTEGQVVPRAVGEAIRWFTAAAEQDVADAQHTLAILYRDGDDGVPRDPAKAVQWLERAAKLDHIPAMVELGIALFNGDGIAKDEARAANLFKQAALRGNPVAQNRYARVLSAGRGTTQNSVDACLWHSLARVQTVSDPQLDRVCETLAPANREAVAKRLENWLKSASQDRS
jgi:TPR repeat protein